VIAEQFYLIGRGALDQASPVPDREIGDGVVAEHGFGMLERRDFVGRGVRRDNQPFAACHLQ
jgi:hypothetical protein